MKKIAKMLTATLLALSLLASGVLAACDKTEEKPEEGTKDEVKMTDGRWTSESDYEEGVGSQLKLKEDNSFYYYSAFTYLIGTWELVEGEFAYYKIEEGQKPDPADTEQDQTEYKGTQQLKLTAFDGTVWTGVYADNIIWNMARKTLAGTSYATLRQDAEYVWNEENEEEIVELTLSETKNPNATISIYASTSSMGSIFDSVGGKNITSATGSYEKSVADGVTTYKLKENGTQYATLTANADGTYLYKLTDGTEIELVTVAWTPTQKLTSGDEYVLLTFAGETEAEDALVELSLWQDNTFDVQVTRISDYSVTTILSGEYTKNADRTYTLTYGTDGEATISAPDGEGRIAAELTLPAGELLAEDQQITVSGTVEEIAEIVYTFTAEDLTFSVTGTVPFETMSGSLTVNLYSDNIAEIVATVDVFGTPYTTSIDRGSYTIDESEEVPVFALDLEYGGQISSAVKEGTLTDTGATIELAYSCTSAPGTFDMGGNPATVNFTVETTLAYEWSAIVEVAKFTTAENVAVSGIPGFDSATASVRVVATNDGKAQLILNISPFGDIIADNGTWTASPEAMTGATLYTFVFENLGTISSRVDFADMNAGEDGLDTKLDVTTPEGGLTCTISMGDVQAPVPLTFEAVLRWRYLTAAAQA